MKIDRAGYPFIAGALLPAAIAAIARRPVLATSFALVGGFLTYFFRDPERRVPQDADLVVSPADGRVMIAGPSDTRWAPDGEWTQITIFLSPMDVHMNRTPVEGRVTKVQYKPGTFLPAFNERSNDNELNEIWLEHDGRTVVVRQVVGMLARRIVCRVVEGQQLARGERIGLMKFGSRMDVFLPPDAELRVSVGQRVIGGETVLGVLRGAGDR
ncbi:MAG: phosphatidylserine decarboxylase [Vicinamibacterales bacterium]